MPTLRKAEREQRERFLSKRKGLIVIEYSDGSREVIKIKPGSDIRRRIIDKT